MIVLPGNQPQGVENIGIVWLDGDSLTQGGFRLCPAPSLRQNEPFFTVHNGILGVSCTNLVERTKGAIKFPAASVDRCQPLVRDGDFEAIGRCFVLGQRDRAKIMSFGCSLSLCVVWLDGSDMF